MTTKLMLSLIVGMIGLWASVNELSAITIEPTYVVLSDQPTVNDEFILEIYLGDSLNQVNDKDTLSFNYYCEQVELDEFSSFYLEIDNSWFCESGNFQYTISLAEDLKTISIQIIRTNGVTSGYGFVCTLRGGIIVKVDEDINRLAMSPASTEGSPFPNPCQDIMSFPSSWLASAVSIEIIFFDGKREQIHPFGNQMDISHLYPGYFILRFHFGEKDLFFKCLKL